MVVIVECIYCDNLANIGEGVWKIKIFKKYWGTYGKKDGPICHDCLANALTGFHTGGGLHGSAIKKIKRVRK